jgi:spore coat protein U-like protein
MTLLSKQCRTLAALLAVVASGGGHFSPAKAETSADFNVAAEIVPGCLVDGLGASGNGGAIGRLDFGTDSTFSTATHSATTTTNQTIRLRCTPGVSLVMSVDGGAHAAAGLRHLQCGASTTARITYALCRDAGCTQPIAIGGNVPVAVSGANSEDVRLPLYASLTLLGALPPGIYADMLTVTLSW